MHGLHPLPLALSSVFALSNHPTLGWEPKFYQGAGGYLVLMMTRRYSWWIWTLAHIMIFSKLITLKTGRAYLASSFLSRKVFALVSGSLFLIQVVGRVVSATILVSSDSQLSAAAEISRICIYQVNYLADYYPPFRSTHLTTVRNRGFWNSIEVSDRYIFQCYNWWENDDPDENLQLHYLTNDPDVSKQFVERSVAEQGSASASSLCRHCLIISSTRHHFFPTIVWPWSPCPQFIYAIVNSGGTESPELLLLRHAAVELHPRGVSRPLVGHDGMNSPPQSQMHFYKSGVIVTMAVKLRWLSMTSFHILLTMSGAQDIQPQ